MRDEVFLIILQLLIPIFQILLQVNFLSCPEAGLCLLVHPPDVVILDGEDDKPVIGFSLRVMSFLTFLTTPAFSLLIERFSILVRVILNFFGLYEVISCRSESSKYKL